MNYSQSVRLFTLGLIVSTSLPAMAHFPVWVSDSAYLNTGDSVEVLFGHGHPFEHYYEEIDPPASVHVILPGGQQVDISEAITDKEVVIDGESYPFWSVVYTPELAGDFIVAVNSALEFGRNNRAYQDYCKAFLNVERQDGWRNTSAQPVEFLPYTRPYGLLPGSAFTVQLLNEGEPVANTAVEIERFNPAPPHEDDIPDERHITHTVYTDANGMITHTLPESGWWMFAAYVPEIGEVEHEGETYSLNGTVGLSIYVDEDSGY